jgi:hypothetical protein
MSITDSGKENIERLFWQGSRSEFGEKGEGRVSRDALHYCSGSSTLNAHHPTCPTVFSSPAVILERRQAFLELVIT